ncbi:hypothetical protein CPB83DRAFT_853762 [Crepidotus variabilis]|uniref:DUF6534 domain-containing protein n=1 Tax=Crepidotus variabilis TaxID=179855 RepID=A0A9P6JQQ5_9AGAR|nr:hypothetical protein CPB83DRAFT_853762 [Crepidotus variabilis]
MPIFDLTKVGPAEVAHRFIFLGLFLNVLLLGVMITQVYLYFVTYKNDKLWIKLFVAGLFFADVLNTGFDLAYLYRSVIVNFNNPAYLEKADWLFGWDPASTAVIAMAVQLFFAWRVCTLTGSWVWTIVIAVLAVFSGATGLVTTYDVVRIGYFTRFQEFKTVVVAWLVSAALGDAVITTILVSYLRKHKTGFERSDLMVDKIIRLTVQTGGITMVFALLDMIFYVSDPSGLHLLFNFPLAKLYSNSVMSGLNSRRGWKYGISAHGGTGTDSEGQVATTSNFKTPRALQVTSNTGRTNDMINLDNVNPAEVFVHVESHEMRDAKGLNDKAKFQGHQSDWVAV